MSRWIPDGYLDFPLLAIQESDEEAICSQQPLTYFNACWPALWIQSTSYIVGDLVHPPTQNGFIYECTVAGDAGAVEPGWGSTQDQEFTDNGVTWKTHENYSLANEALLPSDLVITDGDVNGRKLTVGQKMGPVTHTSGTVTHTALIQNTTNTLHFVSESQTTIGGDNDVISGRSTLFFEFTISISDPEEP